jgi:hypothetical protein
MRGNRSRRGFPALKRADSPSDQVGAALAEGFGKVRTGCGC